MQRLWADTSSQREIVSASAASEVDGTAVVAAEDDEGVLVHVLDLAVGSRGDVYVDWGREERLTMALTLSRSTVSPRAESNHRTMAR